MTEFNPPSDVLKNKLIACQPFCFCRPYFDILSVRLSEQFAWPK